MTNFIELSRMFHDLKDEELQDTEVLLSLGEYAFSDSVKWLALLEQSRVILLAEAGAGKSEEMRTQARCLIGIGQFAFFIPLESLNDGFTSSLESIADEERFDAWKGDGKSPGWFFLDSVDELKLVKGKLDKALRELSKAIGGSMHRARVIISCRPSDWHPNHDLSLVRRMLPVPEVAGCTNALSTSDSGSEVPGLIPDLEGSVASEEEGLLEHGTVRIVLMLPMSNAQIRLFAGQSDMDDATGFLEQVALRDAWTFARRPLDLIQLIEIWKTAGRLGTRQEQHETNVSIKLKGEADKPDGNILSDAKARLGVERLALAQTLTRTRTIRSPEQLLDDRRRDGILDPASILSDWTEAERRALLRKGLFDPATYGRVRFHHRSVQEYLAACRLRQLRKNNKMSKKAICRLLFAEIYGVHVVFPSIREIAAWLALWDDDVRRELIWREPEALLSLGDPESLDYATRCELVRAFTYTYGNGNWRGLRIPIEEVRRISRPDLASVIRECWGDGPANDDVRELLLKLIWLGKIEDCADLAHAIAVDEASRPSDRIISVLALVNCGKQEIVRDLTNDIMVAKASWPAQVVYYLVEDLFPNFLSVDELLTLIERTPEPRQSVEGFEWASRRIAENIEPQSELAATLRNGLADLILRGRKDSTGPYSVGSRFDYLAPALSTLCARQLSDISGEFSDDLVRACVIASRFVNHVSDLDKSIEKLRAHFGSDPALREKAFWAELSFMDEVAPTVNERNRFYHAEHKGLAGRLTEADRPWIAAALVDKTYPEKRVVALHALIQVWRREGAEESVFDDIRAKLADEATLMTILDEDTAPPTPEQEAEIARHEEWRRRRDEDEAHEEAEHRNRDEELRHYFLTRTDEAFAPENRKSTLLRLYQWFLERTQTMGPLEKWDRDALTQAFGLDIAERAEEALRDFWRATPPVLWSTRSAEARNIVDWDTELGLIAVSREASILGWTFSLSPEEVRTAAVFATTEPNGFAPFIVDITESHPKEVGGVIGGEVSGELLVGGDHDYLPTLQALTHADNKLKLLCIPRLLAELKSWPRVFKNETGARWAGHLDRVLEILGEARDSKNREAIARECADRYESQPAGPLALTWLRGLFRFDAIRGTSVFKARLSNCDGCDMRAHAIRMFAALLDNRESLVFEVQDLAKRAQALGQLVRLAYAYVRPEDHIVHEGAYSPGTRDHAETVRNSLLNMLLATSGSEARRVVLELANEDAFASCSDRLRLLVRQRAAEDAEYKPYDPKDVIALENRYEAPPKDRDGLFSVMLERLNDIATDLAHGDFSDRQTVLGIRVETQMQRTLAKRLKDIANDAYKVTRAEEVADGNETDIRLSTVSGDCKAVIEVKIADNDWSLNDLEDALCKQLVGKYMRDTSCKAGCLLLTFHGRKQYWIHPETNKRIGFPKVVEYLRNTAKAVEVEKLHDVQVAVFGLNLTESTCAPEYSAE